MNTRGVDFLVERQGADGLWRDFLTLAGEAIDWPSGFVGEQLLASLGDPAPVERAAQALLDRQHADGGWGYHAGVPTDADTTACVVLLLAALEVGRSALSAAGACLARHQDRASGGVATYERPGSVRRFMGLPEHVDLSGWCSPHLEVTATAGRAFAAIGPPFDEHAARAWGFVRSRQNPDGCWNSYWWESPHYPTLQAALLARWADDLTSVERAAGWAELDGAWTDPATAGPQPAAFATALSLSVLLMARKQGPPVTRATERLLTLQAEDGGWPSDPVLRIPPPDLVEPSSYRVWRTDALGTGVVVRDQHRLFTTAACVSALRLAEVG